MARLAICMPKLAHAHGAPPGTVNPYSPKIGIRHDSKFSFDLLDLKIL
jgi:hypothetical protein